MIQKSYYPLDNEQNVLALLQQGYSFIKVGNTIPFTTDDRDEAVLLTEAIPHAELADGQEYVMLSQFLRSAPQKTFHVDSRYFQTSQG